MIRSWGVQTLNGNAQPIFGDALTAAFTPVAGRERQYLSVASTSKYQVGDRIRVGYGSAGANIVIVDAITSPTVLQVRSEGNAPLSAWANGTILALDLVCADIYLQYFSSEVHVVWVGTDLTVTNTGGGTAFRQILPGSDWHLNPNPQWNMHRTTDATMAGTNADTVGVMCVVV